jgi:dUTP pyrophosphatase
MIISSKIVRVHKNACLPQRQTKYSIGYDIYSYLYVVVPAKTTIKIQTGWKLKLYQNDKDEIVHYAEIRSRSSLACRGLFAIYGLIDTDYDKEVLVVFSNTTDSEFIINIGDRIAQLLILSCNFKSNVLVDEKNNILASKANIRNSGFGSTGK